MMNMLLFTVSQQCRKSLSEFLDGKRRQFPRFYFMSEADLLEVLSNSSQPIKVLLQVDKILLATRELTLNKPSGNNRPSALAFIAGVGKETVKFDAPVKLDGKAENYLLSLLQSQIYALSQCLKMSFGRYPEESRVKWMMKKDENNEPIDPAQVIASLDVCSFPLAHYSPSLYIIYIYFLTMKYALTHCYLIIAAVSFHLTCCIDRHLDNAAGGPN